MSQIKSVNNLGPLAEALRPQASPPGDAHLFKGALRDATKEKVNGTVLRNTASLKFSNHAVDRMQNRGIRFSPEDLAKIEAAAAKAEAKGAKNCLLINDQAAMIVSLKDQTVVTVMDKNNLKENVFTNIDSTVMI